MPIARSSAVKGRKNRNKTGKLPLFLMLGSAVILLIAAFFAFQKKPAPVTLEVNGRPASRWIKKRWIWEI
jgi:hypothetical protein